jgi:hypothetical protein
MYCLPDRLSEARSAGSGESNIALGSRVTARGWRVTLMPALSMSPIGGKADIHEMRCDVR